MNEVRDIIARMLVEHPEPPLRSAQDVVAIARSAQCRRSWVAAGASGVLSLVLVIGVVAAVQLPWFGTPAQNQPVTPAVAAGPAHGDVMARQIVAALPAGMTAWSVETFSDRAGWTVMPDDGRVRILAAVAIRVIDDSREGEVFAYLVDDGGIGGSVADPCAGLGDGCQVVSQGDVTIRLIVDVDEVRGVRTEATRLLTGGHLVVGAWQGPPTVPAAHVGSSSVQWHLPPLPAPLDSGLLVALAADPSMLPS